jgi:hypothetical protein
VTARSIGFGLVALLLALAIGFLVLVIQGIAAGA